jgi:hypothetical protein
MKRIDRWCCRDVCKAEQCTRNSSLGLETEEEADVLKIQMSLKLRILWGETEGKKVAADKSKEGKEDSN